jgi:nondiscriminating glutamyl-tRNA synthetase
MTTTTRFAPSPSGELHLGNARTALFNWLLARRDGGRFLLRIEDTDAERSKAEFTAQLKDDLQWLGLAWDGEIVEQSKRGDVYRQALDRLASVGRVYPCYCTSLEIEISRKTQLASGKPPRYAGTCRHLDENQRAAKLAEGRKPTLRFKVPDSGRVEFIDLVHGEQRFECADIGDFIVQRADGSAAFFFSNIVDDALSGVTVVLRGEDHLSNTPRQLMIAEALSLSAPAYGHISLITSADGSPLSKRHGAKSLKRLKEEGYLPLALVNHLFRLGHSTELHGLQTLDELARGFDPTHLVRSPARFDPVQLEVWQRDAVHRLTLDEACVWLGAHKPEQIADDTWQAFVQVVQANLILPADVAPWVQAIFGDEIELDDEGRSIITAAGNAFFGAAATAAGEAGNDWKALSQRVKDLTGKKGPELFKPLRYALTGRGHGPELAPLLALLTPARVCSRLARWSAAT